MKTFTQKPLSLADVIKLLSEHLGFEELCRTTGISMASLRSEAGAQSLLITGYDGHRRVPIRGDAGLVEFLSSTGFTCIPSLEVKMPRRAPAAWAADPSRPPTAAAAPAEGARMARDQVEKLEDANYKLLRASDKLGRRIDELERLVSTNKEEARRNMDVAVRSQQQSQDKVVVELKAEITRLDAKDVSILADLDIVRKHSFVVEKQDIAHHEEMLKRLKEFQEQVEEQFKEVDDQIQDLRNCDDMLQREDVRQQGVLDKHLVELKRLNEVKVEQTVWKEHEDEMTERITKEVSDINTRITEVQEDLNAQIAEARRVQKQNHNEISEIVTQHRQKDDEEQQRIETKFDEAIAEAAKRLVAVREEVLKDTATKVTALSDTTEAHFGAVKVEVANRDAAVNKRVDDLNGNCQTTFKALDERLMEMVRVERARFGQIEKDLVETTTKLRADCRMEIERVRSDYEKEAARLDADLGDVHVKHDVTKQELQFQQSKLLELRDWAQRQLTETATATRAVQVDSQEGLSASTKMLHALRDDAVGFRDKMAKYVSLLQHSSDSQGEALTALEAHRGKIRCDLDLLITDHKSYTGDMDGWADDVRFKVERLFRAMEPARVEWKIFRAPKRAKDLKKPLGVKSQTFSLRALREVQLEFFPEGTHSSPEGKAILRIYLPKNVHVRYQMWVGFSTEGAMEIKPGGSLSADMVIDDWRSQIQEDGTLPVAMEVLRDLANEDESLAREVRIESP